jgi:hypothetical protein
MTPKLDSICVYCGSADGLQTKYLQAAWKTGRAIAQAGFSLVYGAGKTGLMGAVADGALHAGGDVIGIIPQNLNKSKLVHANLTRLEVVPDIHQRKARMSSLADAFIALPGGYGTLDELFEALTWAQLGLHFKPVGLLNTLRYYDPLLQMIDKARKEGFIFPEHPSLLLSAEDPEDLLQELIKFQRPSGLERWVNR